MDLTISPLEKHPGLEGRANEVKRALGHYATSLPFWLKPLDNETLSYSAFRFPAHPTLGYPILRLYLRRLYIGVADQASHTTLVCTGWCHALPTNFASDKKERET